MQCNASFSNLLFYKIIVFILIFKRIRKVENQEQLISFIENTLFKKK